jgi:hypothetical protein
MKPHQYQFLTAVGREQTGSLLTAAFQRIKRLPSKASAGIFETQRSITLCWEFEQNHIQNAIRKQATGCMGPNGRRPFAPAKSTGS